MLYTWTDALVLKYVKMLVYAKALIPDIWKNRKNTSVTLSVESAILHRKWELISIDNVYPNKAIYFLWIGVTIFHEKLKTLYIDSFFFEN